MGNVKIETVESMRTECGPAGRGEWNVPIGTQRELRSYLSSGRNERGLLTKSPLAHMILRQSVPVGTVSLFVRLQGAVLKNLCRRENQQRCSTLLAQLGRIRGSDVPILLHSRRVITTFYLFGSRVPMASRRDLDSGIAIGGCQLNDPSAVIA